MAAYTNTTIIADTTDVDGFMGEGIDTGFTETMEDLVGVYTEAFLSNLVKYDIVGNWLSLNAVYKLMFSEYACRAIAVEAIKYNMRGEGNSGFGSLQEAEDMLNIHIWRMNSIQRVLEMDGVQDFMGVNS